MRQRLQERGFETSPAGGESRRAWVFEFSRLADHILRRAERTLSPLPPLTETMLIRAVLRDLIAKNALPTFGAVAMKSGFLATIRTLLHDLLDGDVSAEKLHHAAVTPYDGEIAAIFEGYLATCTRLNVANMPRRLQLACDALAHHDHLLNDMRLFLVDGFDQFSLLQMRFLQAVCDYPATTIITMIGAAQGQEEDQQDNQDGQDGQDERPAHRRYARTLAQLQAWLPATEVRRYRVVLPDTASGAPSDTATFAPPLAHIEHHLFSLDTPEPIDADNTVKIITAADREREVRAALRHVHHLRTQGIPPNRIAIVYRDRKMYTALLREVAREYDLAIHLYEGMPLIEAPPIVALLMLLRLPIEDYPRRLMVEVWRSIGDGRLAHCQAPFADCFAEEEGNNPIPSFERAASLLDQAARGRYISGGFSRYLKLVRQCQSPAAEEPSPNSPPKPDAATGDEREVADGGGGEEEEIFLSRLSHEQAVQLEQLLERFQTWLRPPKQATIPQYVRWFYRRVLGKEDVPSEKEAAPSESVTNVDDTVNAEQEIDDTNDTSTTTAWQPIYKRLEDILNELAKAARTLEEPAVSYATFVQELGNALAAAHVRYTEARDPDSVAVLPVLMARGVRYDHLVVLGMVESEFPLRLAPPPLYSRRERALLAAQGISLFAPDPADERSLFYETVTNARQSVTFCSTYLDESGNQLPPSPYIAAVLSLLKPETVARKVVRAGEVPPPEEVVSAEEALVAQMVYGIGVYNNSPAIAVDPVLGERVVHAHQVETQRENREAFGLFEGIVEHERVKEYLARRYHANHPWSVSQFNDYITCPFLFAARHLLHLAPPAYDGDDKLERTSRGLVYHSILAKAGERWIAEERRFIPDDLAPILATLHEVAEEVLEALPQEQGFPDDPFWRWERADIRRRLEHAIRNIIRDEKNQQYGVYRPIAVEVPFGHPSSTPPLTMVTEAGMVRVQGRIDRIDQADQSLLLIDYKSSAGKRPLSATLEGRDIQLSLYLRAAEEAIYRGKRVCYAMFLHLGSGAYSPALSDKDREQALKILEQRVVETVVGVRAGYFAARPRQAGGKKPDCPPGCAFASICRLNPEKPFSSS
jgi:ATP-dependent helicase/DNAse subunit B